MFHNFRRLNLRAKDLSESEIKLQILNLQVPGLQPPLPVGPLLLNLLVSAPFAMRTSLWVWASQVTTACELYVVRIHQDLQVICVKCLIMNGRCLQQEGKPLQVIHLRRFQATPAAVALQTQHLLPELFPEPAWCGAQLRDVVLWRSSLSLVEDHEIIGLQVSIRSLSETFSNLLSTCKDLFPGGRQAC